MTRKTAVEWLREQYHKVPQSQFGNLFEQALSLEREQKQKDFEAGREGIIIETAMGSYRKEVNRYKDFTDYFNQNYGDEKDTRPDSLPRPEAS
jgi:hypothetical protein